MKIVFMGTPDFAVPILSALVEAKHQVLCVVTQPDKPKGRGKELTAPPVKKWALEHQIPVLQPVKIKEEQSIQELKQYQPDVAVVAAFGQILSKEILEWPTFGCINVHASLLPKYRGAAPIQWAVMNGDKESGVTTMQMGEGLDDGDMLLKKTITLDQKETGGSLFERLAVLGQEAIVETLQLLEQNALVPIPQEEKEATHVGMIKKSMGKLDFTRPAKELECWIRGLNPWPSAYTYLEQKTLKVWRGEVMTEEQLTALSMEAKKRYETMNCGAVIEVLSQGICVKTGQGVLVFKEVQLEGKRRMTVEEFLRGRKIEIGMEF